MSPPEKTRVGFTFLNGGPEWHGGLNYFRSLFRALLSLPSSSIEPVALLGREADVPSYDFPSNVRIVQDSVLDRLRPRWFFNRLTTRLSGVPVLANRTLLREGVQVVSHSGASRDPALKSIGWIPDFQHLHLPQFFSATELANRDQVYRERLAYCDLLVVSSESARKDLAAFAPEFAHKARILRFCAMHPDIDRRVPVDVDAAYGIGGPFFYIPNQIWAHKNHLTVIRALAEVVKHDRRVKVLCSGGLTDYRNPDHLASMRAEIERLGLGERFIFLGFVPYPHIAELMLRSTAVINPSLFEGWSTTVEEAKALGVPLILSGIDVHHEQCRQGEAVFFDPLDANQLAERMCAMLSDPDVTARRDPRAAVETYRGRVAEFARAYEAIVGELQGALGPAG